VGAAIAVDCVARSDETLKPEEALREYITAGEVDDANGCMMEGDERWKHVAT
jgi:hypothetical protein